MLTLIQVKQAELKKAYKLTDEKRLYLYVTVKGQKYWRFDYCFAGKRKTLAHARTMHEEASKQNRPWVKPSSLRRNLAEIASKL
ncbi:MAG: DUF4102 domain-containing protein [Pseudomonadales bacterium]|nr:DUF4102 domain-containing protein [Pseudomonadales bacterium]